MANRSSRPVRTCVACREEAGKHELIRLVRTREGGISVDRTARAGGRGAYVHAARECLELARKHRSLERALGALVGPEVWIELGL